MTTAIIITFCTLLLVAYLFDITSSKTRIPSVILLLLLGWFVRELTHFFHIKLPNFNSILPVLGTIGLILIVLEGSLELELNKSKLGLIRKSFLGALLPLFALTFLIAFAFQYIGGVQSLRDCLLNAIPLCIISSAIAIPSVKDQTSKQREFVIYESSLSDIFGVIFFNFIARNTSFGLESFTVFGLELVMIIFVSLIATIGLSYMLNKIENKIKFVPIVLLVILIYTISKEYHLPALIFVLMLGLALGNLDELKRFRWLQKFETDTLQVEVQKFKDLIIEGAFIIRALFFLVFGYLIETKDILNTHSLKWAAAIVGAILLFRAIQLLISKLPLIPLLFLAPRGLITILLFLSIAPENTIPLVDRSLIIQVILLSALLMMFGLMITKKKKMNEKELNESTEID